MTKGELQQRERRKIGEIGDFVGRRTAKMAMMMRGGNM